MDLTSSLQSAENLLNYWTGGMSYIGEERLDVVLTASDLVEAVGILKEGKWGYLSAITGLDHPAPKDAAGNSPGHLEVLYHFTEGAAILTLRIQLAYDHAILPSICGLLPYATLYERELIELFGAQIPDTPNSDRLVLPDDWPTEVYPMRKSFTGFSSE